MRERPSLSVFRLLLIGSRLVIPFRRDLVADADLVCVVGAEDLLIRFRVFLELDGTEYIGVSAVSKIVEC
jgi:hypothetical protein